MAQMNTRWYSGKISTTSSVECKQNAKIEEPQTSNAQLSKAANVSKRSEASLGGQAASGSRFKAGKNTDADSKQFCSAGGGFITPSTPGNVLQFDSKDETFNELKSQLEKIANRSLDIKEINNFLKDVTVFQMNDMASSAGSTDFRSLFPYYFVQTLRHKLKEKADQITANSVIEVHYFEDEMTSAVDNCIEVGQEISANLDRRKTISRDRKKISYKCPKKHPKFKAKFVETTRADEEGPDNNETKRSLNSKQSITSKVCYESSHISKNDEQDPKKTPEASRELINAQQVVKHEKASPKSNKKIINRNISPTCVKFHWPSDTELELDLASVSASNVSSTSLNTTSEAFSALHSAQAVEHTPYGRPVSPRNHELYLARVEQLKNQLRRSIKDSKNQRKALDKEGSAATRMSRMSSGRSEFLVKENIHKRSAQSMEDKIVMPNNDNDGYLEQWSKHSHEKINEEREYTDKRAESESLSVRTTVLSTVELQERLSDKKSKISIKSSMSNFHSSPRDTRDILKERLKRFIEDTKSVDTCLDVDAVTASSELPSPLFTNDTEVSSKKSLSSKSSISNAQRNSQISKSSISNLCIPHKDLLKQRIKYFVPESKAGSSTLDTETAATAATAATEQRLSPLRPKELLKPHEKLRVSRHFDNSNISAHDKEQLEAIGQLKERLRRSIQDFKMERKNLGQSRGPANIEVKYSMHSEKLVATGFGKQKYCSYSLDEENSFENEQKMKTKNTKKKSPRHKRCPPNESTGTTTSKHNGSRSSRNREHHHHHHHHHAAKHKSHEHQKQSSKEKKESRKIAEIEFNDSISGGAESSYDENSLKESKARTSLHRVSSDKENISLTETSSLKQTRRPERRTEANMNRLISGTARFRTTQAKTLKAEKTGKFKRTKSSSTKSTQCTSTASDFDGSILTDYENFPAEMDLKTLINPKTTRSEALSAVLKFRYKSLMDRARGEFAWLQLKKQRYKSKGLHARIADIRKKQQRILQKMEAERNVIQQLLESALTTSYLQIDSARPSLDLRKRPKAELKQSKSAPNLGIGMIEPKLSLSQRLDRVEYMLAWNFKLDEKEADIAALEHMIMACNQSFDISPKTSTKSLLYRISKVEKRLARITQKLTTMDNSSMENKDDTIDRYEHETQNDQQTNNSKLNQFWQQLTSTNRGKSTSKERFEGKTKYRHYKYDESAVSNDFSQISQFNSTDAATYLHRKQHSSNSFNDDGILVLYSSPRVPNLSLNFHSHQSELNEEILSTKSSVINPTFSFPTRCSEDSDHQLDKSK